MAYQLSCSVSSIPDSVSCLGLCPIRYGYKAHSFTVQYFTSLNCPALHSRHFFRIAFMGVSFINVYLDLYLDFLRRSIRSKEEEKEGRLGGMLTK